MSAASAQEEHAEASIRLSADAFAAIIAGDALTTARVAGILAAKRMPELIPLRPSGASCDVTIQFEPADTSIRILAAATASDAASARMQALTAASLAALTLYDIAADSTAVIDGVRLAPEHKKNDLPRRAIGMGNIVTRGAKSAPQAGARPQSRVRPEILMGEVASPSAAPDSRRAAFRNFMTSKRLRPTTWAKDAGVPTGEIMGFLTGRSRGFSGEVAEKLARAARVTVEDMFR